MVYTSEYGADSPITASQRLAEICLTRWAKREGIKLGFRFWGDNQFKKRYAEQVVAANALLKLYSEKSLFKALEALPWCFSLRSPKVKSRVVEEAAKLIKEEIKEANEPEFKLDVSQPQAFAKQFKKNGLEGL